MAIQHLDVVQGRHSRVVFSHGFAFFTGHVAPKPKTLREQTEALLKRYDELFAQFGLKKKNILLSLIHIYPAQPHAHIGRLRGRLRPAQWQRRPRPVRFHNGHADDRDLRDVRAVGRHRLSRGSDGRVPHTHGAEPVSYTHLFHAPIIARNYLIFL